MMSHHLQPFNVVSVSSYLNNLNQLLFNNKYQRFTVNFASFFVQFFPCRKKGCGDQSATATNAAGHPSSRPSRLSKHLPPGLASTAPPADLVCLDPALPGSKSPCSKALAVQIRVCGATPKCERTVMATATETTLQCSNHRLL